MTDVIFTEQELALILACVADSEVALQPAFADVDVSRLFAKLKEAKKQAAALAAAHARYLQVINSQDAKSQSLSFEL